MNKELDEKTPGNIKKIQKALGVVHPFLIAIFPILSLYGSNLNETAFVTALVFMLISLAMTIVLYGLSYLATKNKYKAGFIVSLFLILFYSFGYVVKIVPGWHGFKFLLLAIYVLILAAGIFVFVRTKIDLVKATKVFNVFSLALILVAFSSIVFTLVTRSEAPKAEQETSTTSFEGDRPDIYYIILDSYARGDVLKEYYGYDNSEFLNFLEDKGFYVAENSCSNFNMTIASLPTSLNYEYPPTEGDKQQCIERSVALEMIRDNKLSRTLKSYGYNIVQFGRGLTQNNDSADMVLSRAGLFNSEFGVTLLNSTALGSVFEFKTDNQIIQTLENIPKVREMIDGPRFVFAHILCPHAPFVFDRDGLLPEPIDYPNLSLREIKKMYVDQTDYLNKKVEEMVDKLLSETDDPPIIIIQSDTGPLFQVYRVIKSSRAINASLSPLNAYYFPDNKGSELLYDSITPVNSFRVVLSSYFGEELPLLEDRIFNVTAGTKTIEESGDITLKELVPEDNWISGTGVERIEDTLEEIAEDKKITVYTDVFSSLFKARFENDDNITVSACDPRGSTVLPKEITESSKKGPTYLVITRPTSPEAIYSRWPVELLEYYGDTDASPEVYGLRIYLLEVISK